MATEPLERLADLVAPELLDTSPAALSADEAALLDGIDESDVRAAFEIWLRARRELTRFTLDFAAAVKEHLPESCLLGAARQVAELQLFEREWLARVEDSSVGSWCVNQVRRLL